MICRWITKKEIQTIEIEVMRVKVVEACCMLEKEFPTSFLDIQTHLLVHLVDEVELAGTVNPRWMFFIERFLKVLKDFVRQKAKPEGCMAECWLARESLFYVTEFLAYLHPSAPRLWTDEDAPTIIGEVPEGKPQKMYFTKEEEAKVNKFLMYNSTPMEKWIKMYDEAKNKRDDERKRYRQRNRKQPFPDHLGAMASEINNIWLLQQLEAARERGEHVSSEELAYAKGVSTCVSAS
jgi:hypothetical protein